MEPFRDKYIKYKYKYSKLKEINRMKNGSHDISDRYNTIKKSIKKMSRSLNRILNKTVNIKTLQIPETYADESPILQIVKDDEMIKFYEIANRFAGENSKIYFQPKDLAQGIFNISENNGDKYIIKVVPVVVLNLATTTLCWSWIDNIFLNIPYYANVVNKFKIGMDEYIDKIDYFQFDCVKYGDDMDKMKYLMDDIIIVAKNVLNASGYVTLTSKDQKSGDPLVTYCFIIEQKLQK